ncbi:acr-16, partial [Symbiodinium pilosum]
DYYASGDPRGQTMFEGVGPMNMSTAGILQSLITPAIGLLSILTWLQMRHLSAAWKKQQKEARKARECAPDEGRTRPRWTIRSTVRGLDFGPISSMPYSDESDSSDELMRESFQMNSEKEDMV